MPRANRPSLRNISDNLYPIMERWGITPYISACYAAPFIMANISSDPANPAAEAWWTHKVAEIKALMPTFGGFVVKADSEGNQGPQRALAQQCVLLFSRTRSLSRHHPLRPNPLRSRRRPPWIFAARC